MTMTPIRLGFAAVAFSLAAGCSAPPANTSDATKDSAAPAQDEHPTAATVVTAKFGTTTWTPPLEAEIPADSLGASIRRGLALLRHTTDSLPAYAPGHITCTNCHLQDGRALTGAPLAGSHVRYPKYMTRSGAVISLADRVNYCFTRSLAGNRLPTDSREMSDILTYLAWLSKGAPVGAKIPGAEGLLASKDTLSGDATRGETLYASKCQACHQPDGGGGPLIPALWGPKSYSVGASMAREERAASFIAHNMPLGQGGTLAPQEAFDVAAYINSKPRPDSPGKENDWPGGGAPKDTPYDTRSGHAAFRPPSVLPRATPAQTLVPAPPPVARSK